MASTTSNPMLQYIGGAALAGLAVLGTIYNNRAVFEEARKDVKALPGSPLVGSILMIAQNKYRLHDFLADGFDQIDELTV